MLQNKNSQSYLTDFFHRQYHSYRYFDVKNKYLTCWEYLTLGPVGLGKENVENSQKLEGFSFPVLTPSLLLSESARRVVEKALLLVCSKSTLIECR